MMITCETNSFSAQLTRRSNDLTINVVTGWRNWYKLLRAMGAKAETACKSCSFRYSFGVYVITGPKADVESLWGVLDTY